MFSLISESKTCQIAAARLRPRSVSLGLTIIPAFLKLGSVKECQGFREREMGNGGRVLLVALNLYVRIIDTNHTVTDSTQTINRFFNPEAS